MEHKALLDSLRDHREEVRVQAVADVLFHIETYCRAASLSLSGALLKHELASDQSRDLWSTKVFVDEISLWLALQQTSLHAFAKPKSSEAERQEAESAVRVVH